MKKTLEAIHIQTQPHTSNLGCGLSLNDVWLPLILFAMSRHAPRFYVFLVIISYVTSFLCHGYT